MRELHHENIVAYYGTERTRDVLNIFMEYVPGGSLRQVGQRAPACRGGGEWSRVIVDHSGCAVAGAVQVS
jgi:serine/threonine protein kinase